MYMQILYQSIYNGFNLRPPNCQKIGKLQLPRWGLLKNALLQTLFTLQWGFKTHPSSQGARLQGFCPPLSHS